MDWTLRHFESDMVFDTFAHLSSQTLKTTPNRNRIFSFHLFVVFSKIKNNKPTKRRRLGRIEKRQKRYEKLCFFGKTEKKLTAAVVSELNNSTESMKFRWSPSALDTWFILPPTGCYIVFCFSFVFFFEWPTLFLFLFVQIVNTWDCAWVSCFLSIFWKSLFHFFVCLLARINLIWIKIDRWQ